MCVFVVSAVRARAGNKARWTGFDGEVERLC